MVIRTQGMDAYIRVAVALRYRGNGPNARRSAIRHILHFRQHLDLDATFTESVSPTSSTPFITLVLLSL